MKRKIVIGLSAAALVASLAVGGVALAGATQTSGDPDESREISTVLAARVSLTDAVILGQFAGTDAFGAVSALGNLFRLPLNFFGGLAAGASVVLSQLYGAKNGPGLRRAVGATAFLTLVCGAAFSALGVAFSPACLRAINMPAALYPHALVYTRIYFGGLFFSLIYNMGAGALRAVGDSRRPFYFLIVSCCLNIGLDLVFVALLHMGAAGAALATVLSQAVSALLVVRALLRTDFIMPFRLRQITSATAMPMARPGSRELASDFFTGVPCSASVKYSSQANR